MLIPCQIPFSTPSHVLIHSNFTRWALLSSPFYRWWSKQRRDKQLAPGLIPRKWQSGLWTQTDSRVVPFSTKVYLPLSHTHTHFIILNCFCIFFFFCKCILCFPKPQWTQQYAVLCLAAQSCPTLCGPMDCSLPGPSVHGDSPGQNTGVAYHALCQGIFPNQGSNPGLLHCRWILYCLSHREAQEYWSG